MKILLTGSGGHIGSYIFSNIHKVRGIKEIIFIISQKKLMIKKYFYSDTFYKKIIKKKKDPKVIQEYKKILKYKKMIKFVYQNKPLGTGDAVLKTKKFIKDK